MTQSGTDLHAHVAALFPLCRSITGAGLRETLAYVKQRTGMTVHEVPTGTKVLDWEVPQEWVVRGATITARDGTTAIDFARNNLHLVQYSRPIDAVVPIDELSRHLHSLPSQPGLIPYRTSYYNAQWGFCLTDEQRMTMTDADYHVRVDTDLIDGALSYGELVIPGGPEEMLFSIHCCHPSLANDNLSSLAVAIGLAQHLQAMATRRLTYRFVFVPGTIGAITWLDRNRDAARRVRCGLVLSCLGDPAAPTYKRSRRGDTPIDAYADHLLDSTRWDGRIVAFEPYGYDERQYCSPGFDMPVGCLMRSRNGTFPEYHTSADNPDFVTPGALRQSLDLLIEFVALMESDVVFTSTSPFGEPQLGRRGLYKAIGGGADGTGVAFDQMTLLWVLNQADGKHSALGIAQRSGKPLQSVLAAAQALQTAGLIAFS